MSHLLLFFGLGSQEVILLVLAVLLLFGGKKIPELMRGIGRGIREFNDARSAINTELKEGMNDKDKATSETKSSS
ncbi:MAG: twin-arginine translocase TatA/TatE family subunit [Bacteroidetes bacterium]|nr:twin-arginine translocase TatA/TatE family subunit [Bacteroidota bacterium]